MMRKAFLFLPAICLGIFSPAATPVAFATAPEEAAFPDATTFHGAFAAAPEKAASLDAAVALAVADSPDKAIAPEMAVLPNKALTHEEAAFPGAVLVPFGATPLDAKAFHGAFATTSKGAGFAGAAIAPAVADFPGVSKEASFAQFPGQVSEWHGCARYDFNLHGRDCIVVVPQHAAPGNPWIWRPAFFDAFPSVDIALLEKGFHIAYMDLTHLYGSPRAVELGTKFCNSMHEDFGLSDKVVVEGFSRGGYFAFNWAAANPDKVACLYVDAPVCDITSWPGKAQEDLWQGFLTEWGISDALPGDRFEGNALSKVQVLAQNKIPIISVCGLADKTVPYEDNFKKVYESLIAQGGIVEQILKEDCDHHPHSLENPEPIVDFITRHITGPTN